jgi:hypothetical protein
MMSKSLTLQDICLFQGFNKGEGRFIHISASY